MNWKEVETTSLSSSNGLPKQVGVVHLQQHQTTLKVYKDGWISTNEQLGQQHPTIVPFLLRLPLLSLSIYKPNSRDNMMSHQTLYYYITTFIIQP